MMILALVSPALLSSSLVFAEETDNEQAPQTSEEVDTVNTGEATFDSSASTEISAANETITPSTKAISSIPSADQDIEGDQQDTAAMAADTNIITIPDAALKQEILATLTLPAESELTKADMARLTSLYLNSSNSAQISSLSGLEYATNLNTFYLSTTNGVTDFSPLEQLSSLIYVTLETAALTSSNFPNLTKSIGITNLSLGATGIDNDVLPKIAQLTQLSRIYLDSNMGITTIEPLKNLPNLRSLSVQFCGITDFTVINDFPVLNDLAAYGQNTGRTDAATTIGRSTLNYDSDQQTIFLPFSMMPNRMKNFDGYVPPFTTSTSASNTYLDFNGEQLPANRLQITTDGITITSVTEEEFKSITSIEYNARLDNPAGSYEQPDGFGFYAISSGTYLHQFNVLDDGQPVTVRYVDTNGAELLPSQTLEGFVGKEFTIPEQEISGFTLKETLGNPSGSFTEQEQTVTFVYEEVSIIKKKGLVIAHYVDTDNHTIKKDFVLEEAVDTPYSLEQPVIEGYTFKEAIGALSGYVTDEDQEVTFIYTKKKEKEGKIDPSNKVETALSTNEHSNNQTVLGAAKSNNNNTSKKNTLSTDKKTLPKAGEKADSPLSAFGIILILSASTYLFFRKKRTNR